MLQHILRLCLAFLPVAANAQFITGRVVDETTKEPLAFVHVLPAGAQQGATSDIDGRFSIQVAQLPTTLRFSYVGYALVEVPVKNTEPLLVTMRRNAVELKTVEILPTENPAHRIIDRCRDGRKVNDGMRNRSHRYTSYNKTIFTAEMDTAVSVAAVIVVSTVTAVSISAVKMVLL